MRGGTTDPTASTPRFTHTGTSRSSTASGLIALLVAFAFNLD